MQLPMNEKERHYIEYHPKLGYTVNIMAIVDSLGLEANNTPVLPVELQEALANPASTAIESGLQTVDAMDVLLDTLEDKLSGDVIKDEQTGQSISFQDYLKAIADDDFETQDKWQDFHQNSMTGKTEAELYPIILQSRDSLASAIEFLNEESFKPKDYLDMSEGSAFNGMGTGSSSTSNNTSSNTSTGTSKPGSSSSSNKGWDYKENFDDIDEMKRREAAQLEALVRNEIEHANTSSATLSNLKTKTQITEVISELISIKNEFMAGASTLMNASMEDAIGGDAQNVVENFATMSEGAAAGMNSMLTIVHAAKADGMADLSDRMIKLAGEPVREIVQEEIKAFRKLMDEADATMAWMESVDTKYETAGVVASIEESLVGIDMVLEGYKYALLDLFKMNNMEQIQSTDILDALSSKDTTRKTYQVLGDMAQNYVPSQRPDIAASQFANNMGYTTNRVTKVKPKVRSKGSLQRSDRR